MIFTIKYFLPWIEYVLDFSLSLVIYKPAHARMRTHVRARTRKGFAQKSMVCNEAVIGTLI